MGGVLVTGGAGFIGSHLATKFVELGRRVRVLDNLSMGSERNLAHLSDRIEFIKGDIRDLQTCQTACEGVEFVFHQAAMGSVPKSVADPQTSHECNIDGTLNMLRASVDKKVRRFIYAGSSSAYGDTAESPKHEGILPCPLSPYAVQKLAAEHYARAFFHCYGLESISLRYFNVFGPRQDPRGAYAAAIPAFVAAILKGESPTIFGDGKHSRDFTYIDNVVLGNVLAMQADRTCGEAVNIAYGGQITINEVIATINRVLETNIVPKYVEARAGDVLHSCADIRLARELLGFEPTVPFEEGLRMAIEYYRVLAEDGS